MIVFRNRSSLLGKALRIDVNTGNDSIPYTIPSDNPFVNDPEARPEVYAYGLRNPWRGGADIGHPDTGRPYIKLHY